MYFAKRLEDGHWVALCTDVVLFCNQKNNELNKNTDL